VVATKSIPQCAEDMIESAIDEAADEDPIVLWWDEGGHLQNIVRNASNSLRCEFHAAEQTPLELRADTPRDRTVWYVPQAQKEDVDWFRDVENTGSVINQNVGKLAARCFRNDRIPAASLRTTYENSSGDEREEIAKTLLTALNGEDGLPTLQRVQTRIILEGSEDPVQFVLENGTEGLPDDLDRLRDLLVDKGVTPVSDVSNEDVLVHRTRRWAVAEWLEEEGLDRSLLEPEYRPESSSGLGISRPELQSLLSQAGSERSEKLAKIYLNPDNRFCHDLLRNYESPWELVDCPVAATLEHRLWNRWIESFRREEYDSCMRKASKRRRRLKKTYGDVAWTEVWKQAGDVAELAGELESWREQSGAKDDVVEMYGDVDSGTWRIDSSVFSLRTSGKPEEDVPEEHPATETLGDIRTQLTESEYLDYLRELADLSADQIESGSIFDNRKHTHQFFDEKQEQLQSGQSIVLFIVDALRFDLAHKMAEDIRHDSSLQGFEVNEETWLGTLPSDTNFGKAALTPGSKFSFQIELDDGELVPKRNGRKITNHRREKLLEDDGWNYIMQSSGDESSWSNKTRVAYYWNDIDEAGEKELTDFEEVFDDRVEKISKIVRKKLDQGEWDRAYILADHGFVSLPRSGSVEAVNPPSSSDTVTRRWAAGQNIGRDSVGVSIDRSTRLGYIGDSADIDALTKPLQRFRNQGLPDSRFYHGGALPQEFVLNFVTITQE